MREPKSVPIVTKLAVKKIKKNLSVIYLFIIISNVFSNSKYIMFNDMMVNNKLDNVENNAAMA